MNRLQRLVREAAGYSLVELVMVMVILAITLTALTTVFVQGSTAELDTNRRFQSQLEATTAFDKLRRDVHCASSATIAGSPPTMTLAGCASGSVSWCTVLVSTGRYKLYRKTGATCNNTGKLYGDYLTSSSVFTYTASVVDTSLAKVRADIRVNVNTANALDAFELADDIILRNSTR